AFARTGLPAGLQTVARTGVQATGRIPAHRRTAAAAVVALAALVLSSTLSSSVPGPDASSAGVAFTSDAERAAAARNGVSRDYRRGPPANRPGAVAPSKAAPKPSALPPSIAAPSPSAPTVPAPVGGLTQAEMDNAIAIIDAGRQLNLPRRAYVVALSTALQESHLHNLANANLPESLQHPNEGVG